jgi:hypothetical protein
MSRQKTIVIQCCSSCRSASAPDIRTVQLRVPGKASMFQHARTHLCKRCRVGPFQGQYRLLSTVGGPK